MKESGPILFMLFFMAAVCWFLVFGTRTRHKVQKAAWRVYKLNQEQREMYEAMYFAAVLVLALTFTILLAFAFVRAVLT